MKNRGLILSVLLILFLPNLSCSLNPFENLITQTFFGRIYGGHHIGKDNFEALNSASVPSKASEFSCLVFNVTGYGIEEYETVNEDGLPLHYFRWAKPSLQKKDSNLAFDPSEYTTLDGSNETIKVPIKISYLPGLEEYKQKRQINLLGVQSSPDKSCKNKDLVQILKEDAGVRLFQVGAVEFPNDSKECKSNEICLESKIDSTEVIQKNLAKYAREFVLAASFWATDTKVFQKHLPNTNWDIKPSQNYFSSQKGAEENNDISNILIYKTLHATNVRSEGPYAIRLYPRNNMFPRFDFAVPLPRIKGFNLKNYKIHLKMELQVAEKSISDEDIVNFETFPDFYEVELFSSKLKSDGSGFYYLEKNASSFFKNDMEQTILVNDADSLVVADQSFVFFSLRLKTSASYHPSSHIHRGLLKIISIEPR